MNATRVFVHGLEGSSHGTKAMFFRERYPDMIIEDFRGTLEQRMDKLERILRDRTSLILVGSSFGGLMAAAFACKDQARVKKLVLLAPALSVEEFEPFLVQRIDTPAVIFHGKDDDVVPLAPVYEIARMVFGNLTFNKIDDDHVLSKTFRSLGWDDLLENQ